MAFSSFSLVLISVLLSWSIPKGESGRAFPSLCSMTDTMADSVDFSPYFNNDFYRFMCPEAETIMRSKMAAIYSQHMNASAQLLGRFFHDCIIEGCKASVILDDSNGYKNHSVEKRAVPSKTSVQMNEVLETVCPGLVSCIVQGDDPVDPPSTGRRYNGTLSSYDEATAEIPNTDDNITQTLPVFSRRGFTDTETVSLTGQDIGKIGFQLLKSPLDSFKATRNWISRGFTDRETVSPLETGQSIGKMGCEMLKSRLDNFKGTGTGNWIRCLILIVDVGCLVRDHLDLISDQN